MRGLLLAYGLTGQAQAGRVLVLAPGEQRHYHLEIGVLTSREEIEEMRTLIGGFEQLR